jgi:hypothetical protein
LPALAASAVWLLQCFALFILFTIYGAMWKGAQDQGQRGWAVALVWAVALEITLQFLKGLYALQQQTA